jgi:Na+-transporting NADH:ubiquinone oxidoreductase subunit C
VFNLAEDIDSVSDEEILRLYGNRIEEITGDQTVYIVNKDGSKELAFTVQSPGLWGTITALIAFNEEGTRITGIDFVSHSETPGLGGRIDESRFKEQFRGEQISSDPSARVAVVTGQVTVSKEDARVDAITGATRTSESIQILLNKAINSVLPVVREVVK